MTVCLDSGLSDPLKAYRLLFPSIGWTRWVWVRVGIRVRVRGMVS